MMIFSIRFIVKEKLNLIVLLDFSQMNRSRNSNKIIPKKSDIKIKKKNSYNTVEVIVKKKIGAILKFRR